MHKGDFVRIKNDLELKGRERIKVWEIPSDTQQEFKLKPRLWPFCFLAL